MNSDNVGRFLRHSVVHAGLCLDQSRLSCSRSAKTTEAGVFLLHAWRSPATLAHLADRQ